VADTVLSGGGGGGELTLPYADSVSVGHSAFIIKNEDALGSAINGENTANNNTGRLGGTSYGVYGEAAAGGYGGYFAGRVCAEDTIISAAGGFKFPDGSVQLTAATAGDSDGDWGFSGDDIYSAVPGNVGVGTTSPIVKFNVASGNAVLFGADTLGAGSKLMWIPSKSAFRAGYAHSDLWDWANIGDYSTAMGRHTMASGSRSTATGSGTEATGDFSTAMGSVTEAIGDFSTAMSYSTIASGDYSIAMGYWSEATGASSIAMGFRAWASGDVSAAIGTATVASGDNSTAMGASTVASGDYSTAMGRGTKAESWGSTAIGRWSVGGGTPDSWIDTDPLFEIGNGVDDLNPANAMTVLKNGNVGIGPSSPIAPLQVASGKTVVFGADSLDTGTKLMWLPSKSAFRAGYAQNDYWDWANIGNFSTATGNGTTASGEFSTAMGQFTDAVGEFSTAMGTESFASGSASTAMGATTLASGDYSTTMGFTTVASGGASTAMGSSTDASGSASTAMGLFSTASGDYSTAMGTESWASGSASTAMSYQTTASGDNSTAMGYSTDAESYASTAIGRYNVGGGTPSSWVDTDPLFEIGNGTSSVSRANAMTVLKNGNVGVGTTSPVAELHVDGTTQTDVLTITGGSDLAEPFEINGHQTLDPGTVVVIDDAKAGALKVSNEPYDKRVAGVISGAGGINTGLTLSQKGLSEDGQNVALSGRVYVRATATNGAITPGDLLTTSSLPGHAMKVADADKAPGTVLGKAMSSLKNGEGLVLVLVSLQ
jgi:hypothetical protein